MYRHPWRVKPVLIVRVLRLLCRQRWSFFTVVSPPGRDCRDAQDEDLRRGAWGGMSFHGATARVHRLKCGFFHTVNADHVLVFVEGGVVVVAVLCGNLGDRVRE
jgi:hypothetical protein